MNTMIKTYKLHHSLFFGIILCLCFSSYKIKDNVPCLSKEEKKLYDLIMAYRKQKGLSSIPISISLTKVAQAHAKDLSEQAPYKTKGCNFHSWSNAGPWKSCCYESNHSQPQCMWNKPREIANFDVDGFEIAYGSESLNFQVEADKALSSWKESNGHNTVIINKGIWKQFAWKSIGIGVYKNFACVWFAAEADQIVTIKVCE